jgi:phosphocarrier protein
MKSFEYVITEPVGLHARPAGMLNKEARKFKSAIVVHRGEKSANVLRLMALMGLGVKCGDTIKVTIEGEDEETVAPLVEAFFKENF